MKRDSATRRHRKVYSTREIIVATRDHLIKECGATKKEATDFAKKYLADVRSFARNTKILNDALEKLAR